MGTTLIHKLWQQIVLVLVLETSLVTATGSSVLISIPCQMIAPSFDYEHRFTEHEHRCAEHEQERWLPCHLGWATAGHAGQSAMVDWLFHRPVVCFSASVCATASGKLARLPRSVDAAVACCVTNCRDG